MAGRAPLSTGKKLLFASVPFAALLLLFLLAELIARFMGAEPIPPNPYRDSRHEMEWELRPNAETRWLRNTLVRTNQFGFRDDPMPQEKPEGEYRILFLGDSVIFGYALEQDQIIPHHMETFLNEDADALRYQVINAGHEGYNLFSYYHLLRTKGLDLDPDFLLVSFVINDVYEPFTNMRHYGAASWGHEWSLMSHVRPWLRRSALFSAVEKRQMARTHAPIESDNVYTIQHMYAQPLAPELEEAWAEAFRQLDAIKALADERGIPMLVVAFPNRYLFDRGTNALDPRRRLYEHAREHGIAMFDLAPPLDDLGLPVTDVLMDEIHFTPAGSRLVGRILADAFREARLRDSAPGDLLKAMEPWAEEWRRMETPRDSTPREEP